MGSWTKGGYWRAVAALRLWDLYKTLPTLMLNYGKSFGANSSSFAGAGVEFSSDALDLLLKRMSKAVRESTSPTIRIRRA